jgi:hypothetical protein
MEANTESQRDTFTAEHKELVVFLAEVSSWNNFASSLLTQLNDRGSLSEKQVNAAYNMMAKADAKKAEPKAAAIAVDLSAIFEKFATAQSNGIKRPKMSVEGFSFSLAGSNSRNAGKIYVKTGPRYEDTYLGAVAASGEFTRSRDCTDENVAALIAIAGDVVEAAKAYGRKTGDCSFCRRELTHGVSIALSYGPICAENWGMPHNYNDRSVIKESK